VGGGSVGVEVLSEVATAPGFPTVRGASACVASTRRGDPVLTPVDFGDSCALVFGERVRLVLTTLELATVAGLLTEGGLGATAGTGLRLFDKTEFFAAVEIVLIWPLVASIARDTVEAVGRPKGRLKTDAGAVPGCGFGVGVFKLSETKPGCIDVVNRGESADGVIPFLSCGSRGDAEPGVEGLRLVTGGVFAV
jgi:hypothetical protein